MNFYRNQYLFIGFSLHVVAAFFSIGAHHADEIYQIFEFAGYKLGLNTTNELHWEFAQQMRSGIQPIIVYLLTVTCNAAGLKNPFTIAVIIRLLHGLFSFYVSILLIKRFEETFKTDVLKKMLWFSSLLFWLLPYFHVHFSSESFSIELLLCALLICWPEKENKWLQYLGFGLLCGLSFLVRFQIAFMIGGLVLWLIFVRRTDLKNLVGIFTGFIIAIGIGMLADYWQYGKWTLSSWNYFDQNFLQGKANEFGSEPFYYYFSEAVVQLLPPLSLIIVPAVVVFWWKQPKHWLTWLSLPFVVLHFFVGHKELRFLMPMLVFLPFMTVALYQTYSNHETKFWNALRSKRFLNFFKTVNICALIFVCFKATDPSMEILKVIYDRVNGDNSILWYDQDNPYELGSLNYFRKKSVHTAPWDADPKTIQFTEEYYYKEQMPQNDTVLLHGKVFNRIYTNFPDWIYVVNFGGWVDRAGKYSIYKIGS